MKTKIKTEEKVMTSTESPKESSKISNDAVLGLVMAKVEKIDRLIKSSVCNVYGNRYRVNFWQGIEHSFVSNAGQIVASYFVSVDDNMKLTILSTYIKGKTHKEIGS